MESFGVDLSSSAVRTCPWPELASRSLLRQSSLDALPFQDNAFDLVYSHEVDSGPEPLSHSRGVADGYQHKNTCGWASVLTARACMPLQGSGARAHSHRACDAQGAGSRSDSWLLCVRHSVSPRPCACCALVWGQGFAFRVWALCDIAPRERLRCGSEPQLKPEEHGQRLGWSLVSRCRCLL